MKHVKLLFFLFTVQIFTVNAQTHWVVFTDKEGTTFDPYAYFDAKAIERRVQMGYDLYHYSDFPVSSKYVNDVAQHTDSVSYASRWMNALSVWATPEQIQVVSGFPFVSEIIPIQQNYILCGWEDYESSFDTTLLTRQTLAMQGEQFRQQGIDGKGIRIAIFDGGFPGVDSHPAFEHIRTGNRIIKTYDFVKKSEFVYGYNAHGTMVMSVIGGIYDGKPMGLATGAEFLLARTEKNSEPYSEEVNWAAALEWADQNGADIVNSSLGYTYHRYFPYEMNGQTAFVSRIANTAASKGILVVNAAGNEGDNDWKIIGAPADADGILTVGGINPNTDYKISFSSIGPTTDLRRKPDVSAYGQTIVAGKKGIKSAFGTSFASPLVAGFAACGKQLHPDADAMLLKQYIQQSGLLYPHYDYGHGYGIPQASKIIRLNSPMPDKNFEITEENEQLNIKFTKDTFSSEDYNLIGTYESYLFYAWQDANHVITEWGVIQITEQEFVIERSANSTSATSLSLHFKGYTEVIEFNK